LIIGGGFSGLAAGVVLSRAGRQVRLLEQRPHLGGRAYSFRDPTTGTIVDNGQHILMGCYHATLRFLREIGTLDRIRFQPRLRVRFLDSPGRLSALTCPHWPAPWHVLLGVFRSDSFSFREKLEVLRLGRTLRRRRPRRDSFNSHPTADSLTVDEWLRQLGQSERLRRNFWDLLCIAALNEDPRIAAASLFERVLRLALFTSPVDSCIGLACCGWSDCYTDAARAHIIQHGGHVETGQRVATLLISRDGGRGGLRPGERGVGHEPVLPRVPQGLSYLGACEGVKLADGRELRAGTVLSTAPSFQLTQILPPDLLRTDPFFAKLLELRPAPIISINLWFDRPVTEVDFVGLRGTTIQWLFNKSRILDACGTPQPGTTPAALHPQSEILNLRSACDSELQARDSALSSISLVISGAHSHINRPKEELRALALRELRELLPGAREAKLVHSLVIKERFATFSPHIGVEALRPPATTPVQGLYLAGDWTDTGLPATIEGAVRSGYTAAQVILQAKQTAESTGERMPNRKRAISRD